MELGARTGHVQPLVESSDHARADAFARELAVVVERLQENLLLRSEHPGHRLQQAHPRRSLVSCPDGGRMRHAGRARTRTGRSKSTRRRILLPWPPHLPCRQRALPPCRGAVVRRFLWSTQPARAPPRVGPASLAGSRALPDGLVAGRHARAVAQRGGRRQAGWKQRV
jgi:hypothetical protein